GFMSYQLKKNSSFANIDPTELNKIALLFGIKVIKSKISEMLDFSLPPSFHPSLSSHNPHSEVLFQKYSFDVIIRRKSSNETFENDWINVLSCFLKTIIENGWMQQLFVDSEPFMQDKVRAFPVFTNKNSDFSKLWEKTFIEELNYPRFLQIWEK